VDRAVVGSAASGLRMLVVLASIPIPSRTGLMATTGVLLGAVTIVVSAAAILVSLHSQSRRRGSFTNR
jgi:hypothetical protein